MGRLGLNLARTGPVLSLFALCRFYHFCAVLPLLSLLRRFAAFMTVKLPGLDFMTVRLPGLDLMTVRLLFAQRASVRLPFAQRVSVRLPFEDFNDRQAPV